jgi:uncharacterized membrane protein YhaH (DUF805 family)
MMSFPEAVRTCFRKYAVFEGRASRAEFWFFRLFSLLFIIGMFMLFAFLAPLIGDPGTMKIVFYIPVFICAVTIGLPLVACSVRRIHDTNASGWWYLAWLIPSLGGLVSLVWACIPGTEGENRFGGDSTKKIAAVFE